MLEQIKRNLELYQLAADELGISYAGSLSTEETPTTDELERALDIDDLKFIDEEINPFNKRSNFRYIDKQRNDISGYTRYILANGNEKIVYDEQLQANPYLARQIAMSDAREEGDFEEYNRLKAMKINPNKRVITPSYVQTFLKIGKKLYGNKNWEAITLPINKLKNKEALKKIISYTLWDINKIKWKIKIINLNKETLAVI